MDARNRPGPRNPTGRTRVKTPLWSEMRLEATQRKHPQLPFADWSRAVEQLHQPGNGHHTGVAEAAVAYPAPLRTTPAVDKRKVSISKGLSLTSATEQSPQQHEEVSCVACEPLPASFSPYD